MKIFLDDVRDPPDDSWIICRNVPTFLLLARQCTESDMLSLDHDLGDESPLNGYDAISCLEHEYALGHIWTRGVPMILIHSANPVGIQKMTQAIQSIARIKDLCIKCKSNTALVTGSFCAICAYHL